jgi:DNA-binding NarL/FixJ family response regulator
MKNAKTKRILLVDDHPEVRRGLSLLLEEAALGRCYEAAGRVDALEIAEREAPDVAVVDLSLGDEDTVQLLEELRDRHIPVLVCSMHDQPRYVRIAIDAGVRGYITKGEARDVVHAVRDVLGGWILISPRAAEGLEDD